MRLSNNKYVLFAYIIMLIVCCVFILFLYCAKDMLIYSLGREPYVRKVIETMDYARWERRSFSGMGMSIELPEGVKAYEYIDGDKPRFRADFHKSAPAPGQFADTTFLVSINIVKADRAMLAQDMQEYLDSISYQRADEADRELCRWLYSIQPKTSTRRTDNYTMFRRDVFINDQELINVRAEVLHFGNTEGIELDRQATRRIIDSIELLGNGLAGEIF